VSAISIAVDVDSSSVRNTVAFEVWPLEIAVKRDCL